VSGDGSVEDWTKVKEWAVDIANNGRKEGESCDYHPSNVASVKMEDIASLDLNKMSEIFSIVDFQKALDPSKKDIACAVKHNILCSMDEKICKSCVGEGVNPIDVEVCRHRVKTIIEKLH